MMNQIWGHMWWGWIIWLVILGFLIWLIVSLVSRSQDRREATPQETESPLEILKKRYARGEISKEEFEEKKKDIQG